MIKRILFLLLLGFGSNVLAVCMQEEHALNYNCIPIEDEQSNQDCSNTYGEGFLAYVETEMCSSLLAANLRGEEISEDLLAPEVIEASCLTYEQGQKRGCQVWVYEPALNYCAGNYGDKYLPHRINEQCTIELADELYGFVSSKKLTDGLEPNLAEAEAIMEMLDREGLKQSVGNLISYRPNIDTQFYNNVINGLLGKLEVIQKTIESRSQLKVKFSGEYVEKFLYMNVRYLNLLKRLHKIYAYVAHQNTKSLRSFSFSELEYLNLKVKKVFALEILSQMNLNAKHVQGEMVEFTSSHQNNQIFEYQAMSEPKRKVDYAKLITFLGIRENLNNIWAVDRIYSEDLLATPIRSCGSFLSLRRVRNENTAGGFQVVKENKVYDLFQGDYTTRIPELITASQKVSLIDEEIISKAYLNELNSNQKLKDIIQNVANETESSIEQVIRNDLEILKSAEDDDWQLFSNYHFRTIVLPGDGIQSKQRIAQKISSAAYVRRLRTLKSALTGLYVLQTDKEHVILLEALIKMIKENVKESFKENLQQLIIDELDGYGSAKALATKNYHDKVEQTLEAAKLGARAGYAVATIEKGKRPLKPFDPVSVEDLTFLFEYILGQDFQDLKLTIEKDQKMASILGDFFKEVTEKFNSKYLIETEYGMEFKGDYEERSKALYRALFETAREYYRRNRFEVTSMAKVPEAVLLAREEERRRLTSNPYMIKLYRDDTPVTVHIDEFYAAFQKDMRIYISKEEVNNPFMGMLGLPSIYPTQSNQDMETDGSFGQPLFYYAAKGPITIEGVNSHIDEEALKRLYLRSLNTSKSEISTNTKLNKAAMAEQEEAMKKHYKKVKMIKSSKLLFARLFELFKIPSGAIANNVRGHFQFTTDQQKALANNYLGMIYGQAPILRNEITTTEKVTKYQTSPGAGFTYVRMEPLKYEVDEKIQRALIQKIGLEAYDIDRDDIDENKARGLITKTLDQAKVNVKDKLQKFCKANFQNYAENEYFKDAFKAAKYLRQNLMSPLGTTPENAKRIENFDKEIKDEIRHWWKAFVEDTLEPVVLWTGLVALVVAGIVFAIGTFGSGAPASVAAIAGYLSLFLSVEFFVSLPLATALVVTRINTQFIEVPAQLKFQESLAHSQIDFGKIADYDLIAADRMANRKASYWTIGLLPLDLLYGYQVGRAVRKGLGLTGARLHHKLTGIKLPKYSAPPRSMRVNRTYRESIKSRGFFKATKVHIANRYKRAVIGLRPYGMIDEGLVKTKLLRVALARHFKKLGIHQKPWVILDDLKRIQTGSKQRLQTYSKYLAEHDKLIQKMKLNSAVNSSELTRHRNKYAKFGFVIKGLFKAIKEKRFKTFVKSWGEEVDELYRLQTQLVQNKMAKFDGVIGKIEQFQKTARKGEDTIDDLLRYFSDDDIALLNKASRERGFFAELFKGRQEGYLREMRQVFKDHEAMLESLSPSSYLFGHLGKEFKKVRGYSFNALDANTNKYIPKSDAEDLVIFYESIIRQNAFHDEASQLLRREIEARISTLAR